MVFGNSVFEQFVWLAGKMFNLGTVCVVAYRHSCLDFFARSGQVDQQKRRQGGKACAELLICRNFQRLNHLKSMVCVSYRNANVYKIIFARLICMYSQIFVLQRRTCKKNNHPNEVHDLEKLNILLEQKSSQ